MKLWLGAAATKMTPPKAEKQILASKVQLVEVSKRLANHMIYNRYIFFLISFG